MTGWSGAGTGREGDAVAEGAVAAYCLVRRAATELLGPVQQLWRLEALRRVPVLYTLGEAQLGRLARCMTPRNYAAGEVVFSMGDRGDAPSRSPSPS